MSDIKENVNSNNSTNNNSNSGNDGNNVKTGNGESGSGIIDMGSMKHRGRFSQIFIYLGKLFRMFLFQNDWKVLPMSAVISGLVSWVVGANLFVTQEGTLIGTFALACICIWNGFFNSIQVICRERPIVKREHRSGMHISSYITAHMIYQAALCIGQTIITLMVCYIMRVKFPDKNMFGLSPMVEIGITLFLITYCADIMALMVSALVHSTTTAMTIMPFLLIFQLVFSGAFFQLEGDAVNMVKETTISKWGLTALCSQGDYNSLKMVTLWNAVAKFQNVDVGDYITDLGDTANEYMDEADRLNVSEKQEFKPILEFMRYAQDSGTKDEILEWSGQNNQNPDYDFDPDKVLKCWGYLILFVFIYAAVAVISLEFIDRDKR